MTSLVLNYDPLVILTRNEGKTGANSITGFHIKLIYHLMPVFILFTNIIIASITNSDLSTFSPLDLLKMTYKWGHYKYVIV